MSTKPPSGTRDFLPAEIKRREYVMGVVREVYERYGFEPLETPAFENIETLLGKYGEEGNKLIFKILRRGEHESSGAADLALRYDLTVPLARVVAQYQSELPKFFKRYQIQPVWRADRPAKGRFREFYQCDIDAIGTASILVEAELIGAVSEVLTRLGFADFRVRLNHRKLLSAILGSIPIEMHESALVAIDKWDKIGPTGVEQELIARGIAPPDAGMLVGLFSVSGQDEPSPAPAASTADETNRSWLERLNIQFPDSTPASGELAQILSLIEGTAGAGHVYIDPSLARGLSYYTGAIMEITVPDLAGSLGGGGRYDNLIGMFLGRDIPACGFSLGLERIIFVMNERHMFPDQVARSAVDVMVTLWAGAASTPAEAASGATEARKDALALASQLRRAGLRVDVYPEADKLGKQFKYASSRKVPFVAIVGDDERASGTVSIKNLLTGAQDTLPREAVAGHISSQRPQTPEDS
ncbi:MAG: histidine--tRNA ligase [Acidobacteriota bacterium]